MLLIMSKLVESGVEGDLLEGPGDKRPFPVISSERFPVVISSQQSDSRNLFRSAERSETIIFPNFALAIGCDAEAD